VATQISSEGSAEETVIRVEGRLYDQEPCDEFLRQVRVAIQRGAPRITLECSRRCRALGERAKRQKSVDLISDPDNSEDERKEQTARLKQIGSQLQTASTNTGKDYLASLSKAFEEARPPINKALKKPYGGVSDRIQRLIDQGKIKPPKV
jgi:hypothetical protein